MHGVGSSWKLAGSRWAHGDGGMGAKHRALSVPDMEQGVMRFDWVRKGARRCLLCAGCLSSHVAHICSNSRQACPGGWRTHVPSGPLWRLARS